MGLFWRNGIRKTFPGKGLGRALGIGTEGGTHLKGVPSYWGIFNNGEGPLLGNPLRPNVICLALSKGGRGVYTEGKVL